MTTSTIPARLVVLGTGGTIAGTAADPNDHTGYQAAQLGVADLLATLPAARDHDVVTEQVAQLDSKDMSFAVWRTLAQRCAHWLGQDDVAGIVITHGTDTLEETAWFLAGVLDAVKPVVLTCAMRPATALSPDGPQNLADALIVAATPGARGVLAVCAGTVHTARHVTKVHPYRLDAFDSGEAGPLGYIEEGRVRALHAWPEAGARHPYALARLTANGAWPWVEIVWSMAGASGALVDALVERGVQGLVVAGTGNGTVHAELQSALQAAQGHGVTIVRTTRCATGCVVGDDPTALPVSLVSPVKARVDLLLSLPA